MENNLGDIYQKYCDGSSITDDEIIYAVDKLYIISDLLSELGLPFRLASTEVSRTLESFRNFLRARELKV